MHPLRAVPPILDRQPVDRNQKELWAEQGRVVELAGSSARGRSSLAVSFLIHAQARGEPCAWIERETGTLYPPDLVRAGIDFDALAIVRVPDASGPGGITRAAELLLRSGSIGAVVLDLVDGFPRGDGWQSRLSALARTHTSTVVVLSSGRVASGPLVAVRVEPRRRRSLADHAGSFGAASTRFTIDPHVLRDKSGQRHDGAMGPRVFAEAAFAAPEGVQ